MVIGLYCGIGLILSGMYAMEISQFTLNKVKGSYGTYDRWFQLSITAGICVSSFLGINTILDTIMQLQIYTFQQPLCRDTCNQKMSISCSEDIESIFKEKTQLETDGLINSSKESLNRFMKESDDFESLLETLKVLCPEDEVNKELDRLKDEAFTEDDLTLKTFKKLFSKPEFRVGLFLVCFLQIAQQLSGINIVIAYSSFIYQGSGVEIELIEWMVFGTTLMNFFTTPISLSVQEKGRRTVLLITTGIMGMALFMLFMSSNLCQNSANICPYIAIVPVFAYIVLFSLGLGPIPYIIVQELFDQDAQGAAFNVSVALHWLCNFLVMFVFRMLQMLMESYVYLMFSAIVLVLFGIMYKILPETKNKTMTEIKNSKEYKFALKWLCLQASETTDNQSGNSATEDDQLLHVT
ncbi:SLC2A1 [Mytilus coruscus]|uniref:SLC2A1 n=1 Tax=Mytilus coruscus TaxID=42192 RepID=A0A6J8D8S5_MYTCO|nr:SLC2A1 [Mytilus coruscus]